MPRRRYIDWARALAMLVMIEAHTLDAWMRPALRSGKIFRDLQILGGFAAPLFLWLAGVSVVLSAEKTALRTRSRRMATDAICRRGLEIFILAFLFRIQAFIVSPGNTLIALFRVDILNVMGPAIVCAGIVWGVARGVRQSTMVYTVLAVSVAMLTPLVRASGWVDQLPISVQWYLRPAGDDTTFTLFPWCGFVFAGGAVGALVAATREQRDEWRLQGVLAAAGATLVAGGFYAASLPTIYRASSFWSSSPTFFAIRLGVLMLALPALFALDWCLRYFGVLLTPLQRFGRASLFIYWIHVELVYGYTTWPLRHHLSLPQLAVAYAIFCAAMYGALCLRDLVVAAWNARRPIGGSAERVLA